MAMRAYSEVVEKGLQDFPIQGEVVDFLDKKIFTPSIVGRQVLNLVEKLRLIESPKEHKEYEGGSHKLIQTGLHKMLSNYFYNIASGLSLSDIESFTLSKNGKFQDIVAQGIFLRMGNLPFILHGFTDEEQNQFLEMLARDIVLWMGSEQSVEISKWVELTFDQKANSLEMRKKV